MRIKPEQVEEAFRLMGLQTEQQRARFVRPFEEESRASGLGEQTFIYLSNTTRVDTEGKISRAELERHPKRDQ